MESLPKDILFKMALDSELPAILSWCQTSKKFKEKVCGNDDVWRAKLLKDYPDYEELDLSFLSPPSLKEKYVFMYQLEYIKKLLDSKESLKDIFLKKELDLIDKKLKKIPSFNLPNLEYLYLHSNQLKEVPSLNLPKLQYLSLNENQLTEVRSINLPNLQKLFLSHNQLTEVPSFDLPNLQILYLNNNQLREVPSFNLPNLQILYLHNNQLREVPPFDLPNLRKLFLNNNQLREVPSFNLPNLQILYLFKNKLTEDSKEELVRKYGDKVVLM